MQPNTAYQAIKKDGELSHGQSNVQEEKGEDKETKRGTMKEVFGKD